MTKDDIIRIAHEANLTEVIYGEQNGYATMQTIFHPENIERFANLIAAAEREACAKLCIDSDRYRGDYFAAVILARG